GRASGESGTLPWGEVEAGPVSALCCTRKRGPSGTRPRIAASPAQPAVAGKGVLANSRRLATCRGRHNGKPTPVDLRAGDGGPAPGAPFRRPGPPPPAPLPAATARRFAPATLPAMAPTGAAYPAIAAGCAGSCAPPAMSTAPSACASRSAAAGADAEPPPACL